ncbi:MAG: hypothetical protein R3E12_04940 [Candidatus Eisenbacteria bacterium]
MGPKLSAQRSGEWTGLRGFLRRRQFLVYKHLQLGLLFFALGEVLFFAFVVGAALFLPPAAHVWTEAADSRGAIDAATQLLQLHSSFWPAAGLALIAITLHSIFATHRVGAHLSVPAPRSAMEQSVFQSPERAKR